MAATAGCDHVRVQHHDEDHTRPDVTTVEVIGSPEPVTVTLHPADSGWAAVFADHRRRILEALPGSGADAPVVEHIGSTAVPGLAAKPIVDIVVAVADVTAEATYLDQLLATGYEPPCPRGGPPPGPDAGP